MVALNEPGNDGKIPVVIITRSMADKLFPGENAVGKSFYSWGDKPTASSASSNIWSAPASRRPGAHEYSMIFPIRRPYAAAILSAAHRSADAAPRC